MKSPMHEFGSIYSLTQVQKHSSVTLEYVTAKQATLTKSVNFL